MFVRRSGPVALAVLLAGLACNKTVDVRSPAPLVLATFDPGEAGVRAATIPLPSDLALQAAPSQAGVQREVLFSFITLGGVPGDQVITIPVRMETFDAALGQYVISPTPPDAIDPASVNASTVAIVRLDASNAKPLTPELVGYGPDPVNPATGILRIRPVEGLAVGRYVVALRGGFQGVKTTLGMPLSADKTIALIAPNKDLSDPTNQPPGSLTPAQVTQLETLRKTFALGVDWSAVPNEAVCRAALGIPAAVPFPEKQCWLPPLPPGTTSPGITPAFDGVDRVFPHQELASIQTFEVAAPAVVADTSAGILPFPSDFLLDPVTKKVRNLPSLGPAAAGLAQLDGFSTTSLQLIPLSAPVKASTIPGNVFFYELSGGVPTRRLVAAGSSTEPPDYVLQPPSLVLTDPSSKEQFSTAIGLQPAVPVPNGDSVIPLPPLKPKTQYLVVVTDGVTDVSGHALVAGTLGRLLLQISTPLVTAEGHSNLPGVSDTDAAGLQGLRDGLRAQLQVPLVTSDLGSRHPVMAYTMTTQDVATTTTLLANFPTAVETKAGGPFFTSSAVADFDPTAAPYSLPPQLFSHVKRFLSAKVASLDVLDPKTGALDPTLGTWGATQFGTARHDLPVLVAVPTCSGSCSAPLVVFQHGIFGSRFQMLGVADALAQKGFVVIATDAPFHVDRAFCKADTDCNGGTCTLDAANLRAPGTCTGGNGLAFDPKRLTTVASGNYFISSNFFRLRDAIREDLLDQSALVTAAARTSGGSAEAIAQALAADGVTVDPAKVYLVGMSLGGMIGTDLAATSPRFSEAVLNVAGGTMVDVFTQSPSFQAQISEIFAQLIPGFTPAKVNPADPAFDPVIAQKYAQTLIVAKWVIDPVEPLNWVAGVTGHAAVYGQLVKDDPVVLNPFSLLLYGDNRDIPVATYTSPTLTADQRHGLVLSPTEQGQAVRTDLADFLANPGAAHAGTVTLP